MKYQRGQKFILDLRSPSLRGRGLKSIACCIAMFWQKSPSLRGRGLKSPNPPTPYQLHTVALFTRAWIEICLKRLPSIKKRSPSLRGRGLKYYTVLPTKCQELVALFTRAWIEISRAVINFVSPSVALFTRAWIEIFNSSLHFIHNSCRPLYEGVD